jgi:hypothetical protein
VAQLAGDAQPMRRQSPSADLAEQFTQPAAIKTEVDQPGADDDKA